MRTNTKEAANVAFIIDGYFGFTLYNNIKQVQGREIDFDGLVNSACAELGRHVGKKCTAPANLRQYYMGKDLKKMNSACNRYEEALQLARFGARSRPLQGGREKGIDTMLYSDVMALARSGAINFLILLSGDADHIILVQDLKEMGIKTLLLYGEIMARGRRVTGCSSELRRACFHSVNLLNLLEGTRVYRSGNRPMSGEREGQSPVGGFRAPVHKNHPASQSHIRDNSTLLQKVVLTVEQVISAKEQAQGRRLAFAFQSQVGAQLRRNGVSLPVSLGEFLASYPGVFRTGTHPITQALTVSIVRRREFTPTSYYW